MEHLKIQCSELVILETQISRVIQESLDRRTSVFIDPKLEIKKLDYDGVIFSQKYKDLWTLILLIQFSDYFEPFREYLIYEIRLYLESKLLFPELDACLVSKGITTLVLSEFSKYGDPRNVFGTLLNKDQIDRVLNTVHLRLIHHRRPRTLVYRRGYKDKGSLRPETHWLPKKDWSFDEEQAQINLKEQKYHNTVTSIVRSCGDWVLKNRLIQKGDDSFD